MRTPPRGLLALREQRLAGQHRPATGAQSPKPAATIQDYRTALSFQDLWGCHRLVHGLDGQGSRIWPGLDTKNRRGREKRVGTDPWGFKLFFLWSFLPPVTCSLLAER